MNVCLFICYETLMAFLLYYADPLHSSGISNEDSDNTRSHLSFELE